MTRAIQRFLLINSSVGKHFDKVETRGGERDEEDSDVIDGRATKMFEMKRKALGQAVRNWCVVAELRERNLLSTADSTLAEGEYFGPMLENGQVTPFKVSVDLFMDRVDEWRRDELYPHSCTS